MPSLPGSNNAFDHEVNVAISSLFILSRTPRPVIRRKSELMRLSPIWKDDESWPRILFIEPLPDDMSSLTLNRAMVASANSTTSPK